MNILVTGATGFIGSAVLERLQQDSTFRAIPSDKRLSSTTDWSTALNGMEAIVHCAARVHVMHDKATDPLTAFRATNVEGTLSLAHQAAKAGVKRFIFLSSVKVNGEETPPGQPFKADDTPNPQDAYGISKHEAEEGLRAIARKTRLEAVIIRPPLVYGPGVKGNFAALMKLAALGIPLPFGAIRNRRSLIALDNLVDVILLCLTHPGAANETFLVSDGVDLSTPDLIRAIAPTLGKTTRLMPAPPTLLYLAARLLGRPALASRLCGSLQLDIRKTTDMLGWNPKYFPPATFEWMAKDQKRHETNKPRRSHAQ